jgi:hypothetical protein
MDLHLVLERSFTEARNTIRTEQVPGIPLGTLHRERSKEWIKHLGTNLPELVEDGTNVHALYKHNEASKEMFGLDELLFDILICRTGSIDEPGRVFTYIVQALWQVESEFAKNRRAALADFNKLVLGSGDNKLFIGPQSPHNQKFLETLLFPARACTGNIYIAFIPHPETWDKEEYQIDVWKLVDEQWQVLRKTS